jgi:hypothetical protein
LEWSITIAIPGGGKEKGADSCNLAREWRSIEKKAQEFFI